MLRNFKIQTIEFLVVFLFASFVVKADGASKTEVMVISSMHGYHKNHPTYDYETLYSLVRAYTPDFVGVEIRPEDLESESDYLRENYPREMIDLANQHKGKVFGFDWLGDAIEGKPIPVGYWKSMRIKQLLKAMDKDEVFLSKRPKALDVLKQKQIEIIEAATPASLNDGRYGQLCREIDQLEKKWYKDTVYEEVFKFDRQRDAKIGENINKFIASHHGSRIVMIMGADHRTFAIENINKRFNGDVVILPVENLTSKAGRNGI